MKLHFESDLDYQLAAIEAVCDLFRGQEVCRGEFTVSRTFDQANQMALGIAANELGIGNRLALSDEDLLRNLQAVQLKSGLAPSAELVSRDFTVEMETGTGKTYVYLRSVFELHRRYGFTKFIVVVPSVAIKEGVYKSLQIMAEHFRGLYANPPFDFFLYDSGKLGQVRNFATSPNIQVMILTVGAINKKDVNNLYKDTEKTGGERPIDLIKATRPILIVDEPQSVDGGLEGRGKEALGMMSPLCTLRYSATHADHHHMVYRLDAVDAYQRKLVKLIEVDEAQVDGGHNRAYVKLLATQNKRNVITAKVEVHAQQGKAVVTKELTVQQGDMLDQLTGRELYANFRIGEIRVGKDREIMELLSPGQQDWLKPGEAVGGVNEDELKRLMIRRTIKNHLDKEKRLGLQGIKVLSLFFIDAVQHYRTYDADGNPKPGKYAQIFEDEYRRLAKHPDYQTLFKSVDVETEASLVHNGYFSIDKVKVGAKTVDQFKDTRGDSKADDDTYNLIMRDKEKLLSFESKLKFIFSHSALKEGWDNPNVFQICALRDMHSEQQRRQTIGRGLRLCVNQQGERMRGFEINTLTVIATESYEQFAENLQREIEKDTGLRFGIVELHSFANIPVTVQGGGREPLGVEASTAIWTALREAGMIDHKGRVQESLRAALKDDTLVLPAPFAEHKMAVKDILRKLAGRLEIKKAADRRQVQTRQAVLDSADFKALWDRIKHKTTYRVEFDNERMIRLCTQAVTESPPVPRTRLIWRKADLSIGKAGVEAVGKETSMPVTLDETDIELPDLLTELQDRTQLTRRSLVRLLKESGRLDDFRRNPQLFIQQTAEAVNKSKRKVLVDGIKYQQVGQDCYYAQELFQNVELTGYIANLLETKKSVFESVVYDSGVERSFAEQLEQNEAVKVYAKLPRWFEVPTPLGSYIPDWAVLVTTEAGERLYFVVETKDSLFTEDLRDIESAKIRCGEAHFNALVTGETQARYVVATKVDDLMNSN